MFEAVFFIESIYDEISIGITNNFHILLSQEKIGPSSGFTNERLTLDSHRKH
jgi:hypothetical protein